MTFTVDGYTLNVTDFSEQNQPVASEWHAWQNQALTLKHFVYGLKRVWTLSCVEKDVAWVDSAALYLRNKAASGETVTFTVDEGSRYQLSATTAYVVNVSLNMRLVGGRNIRYFNVTIKET